MDKPKLFYIQHPDPEDQRDHTLVFNHMNLWMRWGEVMERGRDALAAECLELRGQLHDARISVQEHKAHADRMTEQKCKLEEKLQEKQAVIMGLHGLIGQMEADAKEAISKERGRADWIEECGKSAVEIYRATLKEHTQEKERLEEKLKAAREEIEKLKDIHAANQKEIAELHAENIKFRLHEMFGQAMDQGINGALGDRVEELKKENAQLLKDRARLKKDALKDEAKIHSLIEKQTKLYKDLEIQHAAVNLLAKDKAEMGVEIRKYEADTQALGMDLGAFRSLAQDWKDLWYTSLLSGHPYDQWKAKKDRVIRKHKELFDER